MTHIRLDRVFKHTFRPFLLYSGMNRGKWKRSVPWCRGFIGCVTTMHSEDKKITIT